MNHTGRCEDENCAACAFERLVSSNIRAIIEEKIKKAKSTSEEKTA